MRIWDGRYRVERTLGEGGMGQVLLARDLLQGERLVAVKLLLPDYREATSDFMREYSVQRRLDHPAIPAVSHFGFARHQGREVPYFAMDYVVGVSLHDAMAERRDPARAWPWVVQLLRGLDHLHRQGYLHRDIKPGNVIVSSDAPPETAAHIIDFGIAIPFIEAPEKLFLGTPEYSAPELMSGAPFDARQDLYAVGLLLYELIAHRRPWAGVQPTELYNRRMYTGYPPLAHPSCPPELSALVDDLLRASPDLRPVSAAATLERFARATGVAAPIETATAFRRRLGAYPFPFGPRLDEAARLWLGAPTAEGLAPPAILVIEDPPGWDGGSVIHELTDRAAVSGARILRYALEPRPHGPLEALEPALAELRRLREGRGPGALGGLAGAATLLTRLPGPTVIAMAGLEWADTLSLEVLKSVFTGAKNPGLRLLATVDPTARPVAAHALGQLASLAQAQTVAREPLSVDVLAGWLDGSLGHGTVPRDRVAALAAASDAGPDDIRAMLGEDFERGALVRTVSGYHWTERAAARSGGHGPGARGSTFEGSGSGSGELRALIDTLATPVPDGVAAAFLGLSRAEVALLVAEGHLARVPGAGRDTAAAIDEPSVMRGREPVGDASSALRATLHERLARAVEQSAPFRGRADMAARAWLASSDPLRALPYLLTAANEALAEATAAPRGEVDGAATARRQLDQARATLDRVALSNPGPRVRERLRDLHLEVCRARLGLARDLGERDAWFAAALELHDRAAEVEHEPSMAVALDALVHLAADRGAWDEAERHLVALARVAPDNAAFLRPWLAARVDACEGRVVDALRRLEAVDVARVTPERHLELLGLEAELRVAAEELPEAQRAIGRFAELAWSLEDRPAAAHARLLEVARARAAQEPDRALGLARELAPTLGPTCRYRLEGRLDLELARAALELGQPEAARRHAERSRAHAERDGDRDTALDARLVCARAALALGEVERAWGIVAEADRVAAGVARGLLWELELTRLELALAAGRIDALRVAGGAERLAAAAEAEGLRGLVVRGLALAARACIAGGLGAEALGTADRALERSHEWGGVGLPRHVLFFLLAQARWARREGFRARYLLGKARSQLTSAARRLPEGEPRLAFLATAWNARIERGELGPEG